MDGPFNPDWADGLTVYPDFIGTPFKTGNALKL
jgi:hypothetical protein